MTPIIKVVSINTNYISYNEDIYIGIKQLSEYLIGSYFVSLDDEYTYISRENKEMSLYYNGDKLVKKPGYEVILSNIDDAHFEIVDSFLYVTIARDEAEYRFLVSYIQQEEINNEE